MKLKEAFQNKSQQMTDMSRDPWFVGSCFGIGLALMPLSPHFGLMAMAVPTIYGGVGISYKIASASPKKEAPAIS